jgi:hypothetical protein
VVDKLFGVRFNGARLGHVSGTSRSNIWRMAHSPQPDRDHLVDLGPLGALTWSMAQSNAWFTSSQPKTESLSEESPCAVTYDLGAGVYRPAVCFD